MSKIIKALITCPKCSNQFDYSLYRSIWGENPVNRELVMTDKINVAVCPQCNLSFKLPFPFIYTNAEQYFAVWWEPEYDPQIDIDSAGYTSLLGEGNYLATAPRVKDWNEFKETIIKFEKGELKGKPGTISPQMQSQMEGFFKSVVQKKKSSSGCLLSFLIYGISLIVTYILL